jgi:tetratricopeptide (TPR) repeat protein
MTMIRRYRALALVVFAIPFASLRAQGGAAAAPAAPPACPVETMQPNPLGIAFLQRGKIVSAKTPDEAMKGIREAMKQIWDDKNKSNPLGRDFLLAQFYVLAMEYGDVQTREKLGIPGDKAASVDLVTGADSLFTIVVKAQPTCATEIEQWREYKPYQALVQAAYKAITAGAIDSAEKMAKRAQILSKAGPQPYDILWRVAQKRGDEAGMIANLNGAIEKLAGDTANAVVRSNFMYNLGRIQMDFADKKTDKAAKMEGYRNAAKAYMAVLREYPASDEAPFALSGIASASTITSDTAMALAAVEVIKAAPSKFSDMALATAGVLSTKAGKTADAVLMFEAATKVNPYSRDYLYNYAAMLYEAKRSAEMMPIVTRLVAIDPSNSENIMLFAFAFKGLSDNEKDPAKKKALIDSTVAYGNVADAMNLVHKVLYTEFDRGKDHTTLRGQVENHGKAAKSYTLDFEFVGKDGAVLAKQSVSVANVPSGGAGDFVVDIPTGGVYGVRYTALPLK